MVTDVMGSRFARDWLVVQFSQLYRGWGVKKNEAQRVIRKKEIASITHCVLRTVLGKTQTRTVVTYCQVVYTTGQLHTKSILSAFPWIVKHA